VQAELTPAASRVFTLVARNVDAGRAAALGVLDELVPPADVLTRALAVAEDLAVIPAAAYGRIKRQLRGPTIERIEAVVASGDPLLETWVGPEAARAAAALLRDRGDA
jgi:enoyl-CoA hydratase